MEPLVLLVLVCSSELKINTFFLPPECLTKYQLTTLHNFDVNDIKGVGHWTTLQDQACELYYRLGLEELLEQATMHEHGDLLPHVVQFKPNLPIEQMVVMTW